jgi:drug/metabolite transporter (DMT)-like permease
VDADLLPDSSAAAIPRWHHAHMPTPHAPPHFSSAGALGALHVGVALFGFAGLFGKWIPWDPVAIVLGRTAVAAVVLAFVVRYRRGRLAWPSARVLPNGLILAIHWIAFFAAIQESTVAIGLLGYASFPMFVPLLERTMLGIAIRRRELAKVALVVAGLLLLVPEWNWASHTVRGLAWGVLSGFMFALMTVRTRKLSPGSWSSEVALWQNAVAALCVAPFVFAHGGTGGGVSAHALLLVLLLGVFCTALAHSLYIASLARLPATTAAIVAALEPVYGIALAWWLLHEVPDARTLAGALLLVAAAALATHGARRASGK